MAIRLSGLTSGMDTDAIVQELVSAYSMKTEKYEKQQTKLTWKQDAWKNLNTKIYGLYTNVSNMRFSSAYNLRKTSVSDNTKATVTASADAVTGTQTLNILKTAQASYMTGGQLPEYVKGEKITADSTLEELGFEGGKASFKLQAADGSSKKIDVTKDTTIGEVINKLKEAGVNANFDANNRRIFVSAKKAGAENDFNLIGDTSEGLDVLTKLGLNSSLIQVDENGNKTFTEAAGNYAKYYDYYNAAKDAGVRTWDYLKNLYADFVQTKADNNVDKAKKDKLENDNRAWEATNRLLEEQLEARRAYNRINSAVESAEETSINVDLTAAEIRDMLDAVKGKTLYDEDGTVNSEALDAIKAYYNDGTRAQELTDEEAEAIVGIFNDNAEDLKNYHDYKTAYPDKDILEKSVKELNAQLESNRTTMAANEVEIENLAKAIEERNIFINANPVMEDVWLTSGASKEQNEETQAKVDDLLGKISIYADEAAVIYANEDNKYSSGNASKITGSDAEIMLNGVTYTSNDNSFSINGLTINALAKTKSEITITTSIDTQGIYDKVKDFLTEYNNVINEMAKLYNAESASDYEPLTDEEKEAMSEEQIEKWEGKIKDSLLRRDTTLNSIMSVMVNSMAQVIEIDGEKLSLTTFGIHTLGFLNSPKDEHYAYHIDGDEDDENTSGKEDELMKAIQEDPEKVEAFMKKLSENLYKAIDNKMKSTELSSAYKVYNDKEMDKEAKKYAEAIAKWEEKVKDKEDYYFKQFSNMEVALSKLQSQTSSISGLLGM